MKIWSEIGETPGYKLVNLHGRPVAVRIVYYPWEKQKTCPDCGDPALYQVTEFNPEPPQPKMWFYCGGCSIGG